mmetsp:Transcript_26149/g.64967  ORF Transcript_26149/g.64967 Transcript_26149/m.64967 type:complete len:213 (+) Transcript_26149:880-1518(+)
MPPPKQSTPNQRVSGLAWACFCRSLLSRSMASKPELAASALGMHSSALAYALMTNCCLPLIEREYSRRYRLNSISMAPPPPTTQLDLMARRTIMMASWSDLSASSTNCWAPPRRMIVADLVPGHSLKRLYRSDPIWISSNSPHVPRTSGVRLCTVVWTAAPVARCVRRTSCSSTRPAQNTSRSAKYCVARSPIGSRLNTTLAPLLTMHSSFS